MLTLLRLPF